MDFWPEFLASSWGREFVAGGFGGTAGVLAGYPLDTLRIRQQHSSKGPAFQILRRLVASEGPFALYRGMTAPLASVTFQNFLISERGRDSKYLDQTTQAEYENLNVVQWGGKVPIATFLFLKLLEECFPGKKKSQIALEYVDEVVKFDKCIEATFLCVALGGIGTGAIQSLLLSPVELVKIRLQLQARSGDKSNASGSHKGPLDVARSIFRSEGWVGLYRGLTITVLRDAPAHGVYFWTYEYMREQFHPGCRKNSQETFATMLLAGGLAGVASWIAATHWTSVKEEGYNVLWRGLGTAVGRAFIVNGAIFTAYETALRCIFCNGNGSSAAVQTENAL
ncbi:Mitochondrial arginine transporter BAC2 [Sesamum angolense]|uniref:Mitochondrial arginine transporter BAC2 n=1 Tax=Sesamum angolense TaxID=2727404 RepID=A0AAE1XFM4_9LAMI|nr:Mitochondrial arginine transporter BAC2 [Sesamum angolense]